MGGDDQLCPMGKVKKARGLCLKQQNRDALPRGQLDEDPAVVSPVQTIGSGQERPRRDWSTFGHPLLVFGNRFLDLLGMLCLSSKMYSSFAINVPRPLKLASGSEWGL